MVFRQIEQISDPHIVVGLVQMAAGQQVVCLVAFTTAHVKCKRAQRHSFYGDVSYRRNCGTSHPREISQHRRHRAENQPILQHITSPACKGGSKVVAIYMPEQQIEKIQ